MTVVLITGTGRGIGYELASQALDKGWTVYGSAREEQTAFSGNPNFHPLVFDVTDDAAVRVAAEGVVKPIDIVINNAGVIGPEGSSSTLDDLEGFARMLAINTIAPVRIAQAFLPHLRKSASGRLVTISSLMGSMSHATPNRIGYRASKAAVNKLMQGFATDLKADGIAAISVHPGWVRSDMGGSGADISPQESAGGLLTLAENLTMEQSGRFWNWDGRELPW